MRRAVRAVAWVLGASFVPCSGSAQTNIPPHYRTAIYAECRSTAGSEGAARRDCLNRLYDAAARPGAIVDLAAVPTELRERALATCTQEAPTSVAGLNVCLRRALSPAPGDAAPQAAKAPPPAVPKVVGPKVDGPKVDSPPAALPPTFPPVLATTLDCRKSETLPAVPAQPEPTTEARGLSLGVLQDRLQQCQLKGNCTPELLHLGGLASIDGMALDPTRNDIVVWGKALPGREPTSGILTSDLVVALRSAWGFYDEVSATRRLVIPPVVSIDPRPEILKFQEGVREQALKLADKDFEAAGRTWIEACRSSQKVRLEGVPKGSHVGHVLLKADYDLKHVANGTIELAGWGVESMERHATMQYRDRACSGGAPQPSVASMDRFWFHGGRLRYVFGNQSLSLDDAEVVLSTEAEMVSRDGTVTGQKRASPPAQRFVTDFTKGLVQAGQAMPIFEELRAQFRLFGLATAARETLGEIARSRLGWLLEGYAVPTLDFRDNVEGRGRFTLTAVEPADGRAQRVVRARCGGVEVSFPPDKRAQTTDQGGAVASATAKILNARPANALWWRSQ